MVKKGQESIMKISVCHAAKKNSKQRGRGKRSNGWKVNNFALVTK